MTSSASTRPSSCRGEVWVASGHVATFTDPLSSARPATSASAPTTSRRRTRPSTAAAGRRPGGRRLPQLRQQGHVDRAQGVQRPAEDLPRPGRGHRAALPAPRDRAGHLHQLRATCSTSARKKPPFGIAQIGKSLPQRDHAGQLHLPHPRVRADGDGVLRQARHRRGVAPVLDRRALDWYVDLGHRPRTTCGCSSTRRRSSPTTRSAPSTSSTGSGSAARSGASSRASPTAPTSTSPRTRRHSGTDLSYFDQETGERWTPVRHRARRRV